MERWQQWAKRWLFKYPLILLVSLILVKVVWVWLFRIDGQTLIDQKETNELLARRTYLVHQTSEKGVGPDSMPASLPAQFRGEWALVSYSMTSAALTNIAFTEPETRAESLTIVTTLIEQMLTPDFRQFDTQRWGEDALETLGENTGHIGYLGHLNFALAAYHALGGNDPSYRQLFHDVSHHLDQSLRASSFLNARTYPSEIYVPDNAVVVASLALFDQTFPNQATGLAPDWLTYMDSHLRDPETGLFAFSLSSSGEATQWSRGSGSGWNTFFLYYADPAFAQAQYALLKEHFYHEVIGIAGISEWSDGKGFGDVDSGPLFFELSPAGTGFALSGATFTQDTELLNNLLLTAELGGFSVQWQGRRHYAMAPLVGDTIILAMMSTTEWDHRFQER